MSDKVYLTSIQIRDVGGIHEFRAQLGTISVFQGANGAGKTSALAAIRSFFEPGGDPELIRLGSEDCEMTITFSDGYTAWKKISKDELQLVVKNPQGGIIKGPATWLKERAPMLSWDPLGFLAEDPRKRAEFLLKNIPMTFLPEEVNLAVGSPIASTPMNLSEFNALRDGKYDERTKLNGEVKNLEGSIQVLRKSLPPDDVKDWGAEVVRLQDAISALDQQKASIAAQIELEAEQARNEKRQAITAEIEELRRQIAAKESALAEYLEKVNTAAAESLAEQSRVILDQKDPLVLELSVAKANAQQHERAAGVRSAIETHKETMRGHVSREMGLTAILKSMDALKHQKLKELPIDGLDLKMDSKGRPVILINGIALDKLNRQQQLFVAIQAVSLASGILPLIVCECAEVDDNNLAELTGAAKDAGMQLILARWKNSAPLEVVAV